MFVLHRSERCDVYRGEAWDHLDRFLGHLIINAGVSAETLHELLGAAERREQNTDKEDE